MKRIEEHDISTNIIPIRISKSIEKVLIIKLCNIRLKLTRVSKLIGILNLHYIDYKELNKLQINTGSIEYNNVNI